MRIAYIFAALMGMFAIVGCSKNQPECQGPGCKFVYERRIEDVQKPAQADRADHVMTLFSATGRRNQVTSSHCFALFCKVNQEKATETVTISWMPKSGRISTFSRSPEIGENMSIADTLAWANSVGATVERFGPYYIKEELYQRAKFQEERLTAGHVRYKVVDTGMRPNNATNCIHAISDILCNGDQFDKFLVTGRNRGRDAAAVLKTYFDQEGYIDGRYRNDAELQRQFNLQSIRRID